MASSQPSSCSGDERQSVNAKFACYWLDSCNGDHELNDCQYWKQQLRGKSGIYYSSDGVYRHFDRDHINDRTGGRTGTDLHHTPTGCTKVHLLIYTVNAQHEIEIMFGLRACTEKVGNNQSNKRDLLSLPSSRPCKRGDHGTDVALRAFEWISDQGNIARQGLQNRFLFLDSSVIYSLRLNNFVKNKELKSLHWFPLKNVLATLPILNNYLISGETTSELAQYIRAGPVGIELSDHQMWSLIALFLTYIREYVPGGFDIFLPI